MLRTNLKSMRHLSTKINTKQVQNGDENFPPRPTNRFRISQRTGQKWESVIGLEVHAQINSKTKLFSASNATEEGKYCN